MDNTPVLNTSPSTFNYIDSEPIDNNLSLDPVIKDGLSIDNANDPTSNLVSDINSTPLTTTVISNDINMLPQCTQQTFPSDYIGPVMKLVECIDLNKNLGNWHPIKGANFFSTNFTGITDIKPAGSKHKP